MNMVRYDKRRKNYRNMSTMYTLTSLYSDMDDMSRRKNKLSYMSTIKDHSMITAERTFSASNDRFIMIDELII